MTTPAYLRALAKRVCEEPPSRDLDLDVALALGAIRPRDKLGPALRQTPACTTSLDAAASLTPEGWRLCALLHTECGKWLCSANKRGGARIITTEAAPTEPQARTAAALLAMAVDMEDKR